MFTPTIRRRDISFRTSLIAYLLLVSGLAQASVVTQPPSLNPGDQYRLVFVTSGIVPAESTDIAFYNDFVSNAANAANLGVDWKVIGSTQAVGVWQNTNTDPSPPGATGVPIFMLDGTRVATDYDDLWDGTLEGNRLNVTEYGLTRNSRVWTGTYRYGSPLPAQYLGDVANGPLFGNSNPSLGGALSYSFNFWIEDWADQAWQQSSLYAISGILRVPGTPGVVPEAASFLVWGGLATTVSIGVSRRRGRRVAS